jgi:hypothetical protein
MSTQDPNSPDDYTSSFPEAAALHRKLFEDANDHGWSHEENYEDLVHPRNGMIFKRDEDRVMLYFYNRWQSRRDSLPPRKP